MTTNPTSREPRLKNATSEPVDPSSFEHAAEEEATGAATRLRPDLNGMLLKQPNNATVYLIDGGYRRTIPSWATFQQVFRAGATAFNSIEAANITVGVPMNPQAVVVLAPGQAPVYLVDAGPDTATVTKRWVPTPAIFDEYQLAKPTLVPPLVLQTLPSGPALQASTPAKD